MKRLNDYIEESLFSSIKNKVEQWTNNHNKAKYVSKFSDFDEAEMKYDHHIIIWVEGGLSETNGFVAAYTGSGGGLKSLHFDVAGIGFDAISETGTGLECSYCSTDSFKWDDLIDKMFEIEKTLKKLKKLSLFKIHVCFVPHKDEKICKQYYKKPEL